MWKNQDVSRFLEISLRLLEMILARKEFLEIMLPPKKLEIMLAPKNYSNYVGPEKILEIMFGF